MVAQITEGTAFDKHGRPFRRRNARPAIALLIVLLVASAVVWTIALTRPAEVHEAAACNPPPPQPDPAQPHLGTPVSRSTMSRAIAGRELRRRKGRPCLSNAVPSVICATTVGTLNGMFRAR